MSAAAAERDSGAIQRFRNAVSAQVAPLDGTDPAQNDANAGRAYDALERRFQLYRTALGRLVEGSEGIRDGATNKAWAAFDGVLEDARVVLAGGLTTAIASILAGDEERPSVEPLQPRIGRPRCSEHKARDVFPEGCKTCRRIKVEADVVTRVVDALLGAGFALNVDDGDGRRPEEPTKVRAEILAELMDTDDEHLMAWPAAGNASWVRFVYGNDGPDVMSDYTTNLDAVLKPVNDYVESIS